MVMLWLTILSLISLRGGEVRCRPSISTTTSPPSLSVLGGKKGPVIGEAVSEKAPLVAAAAAPEEEEEPDDGLQVQLVRMKVESEIRFRYGVTKISAYYKNPSSRGREGSFRIYLPEEAFISNLTMKGTDGKEYVSRVKDKDSAQKEYESAVSQGETSAGLVSASSRQNRKGEFNVKSFIEPSGKMEITLVYEELLERKRSSFYQQGIRINTGGKIIPDFKIHVSINESLPLSFLSVPVLLDESNSIDDQTDTLPENSEALVERDSNSANITFVLDPLYQKERLGREAEFLVRYDVDRKESSEIQVIDGYFVHFLAPQYSGEPLPKHVVFVLDVSGSMGGTKIQQLKDAMITVIQDLGPEDRFNILTFSDEVWNWVPFDGVIPLNEKEKESGRVSYPASDLYKDAALDYVLTLNPIAGTNINGGMLKGLETVEIVANTEEKDPTTRRMLLFLTDGQATSGETTDSKEIARNVRLANRDAKADVYGLAFGDGADFDLIKTLSTGNGGFARRIHSGADAALQLESFFQEISNPVLANLKVDYVGESLENVTDTSLNTFFRGEEFIIAGKLSESESKPIQVTIQGGNRNSPFQKKFIICLRGNSKIYAPGATLPTFCPGPINPLPKKSPAQNFIERLWAFKTIKSLLLKYDNILKETEVDETKSLDLRRRALDLAIKYNFVTPLTSLVVVKEDDVEVPLFENPSPIFQNQNSFMTRIVGGPSFSPPIYKTFASPPGLIGIRGTTGRFRPRTTTTPHFSVQDIDNFDNDYIQEDLVSPSICTGNITLYSKTYNRGENITLTQDESDLMDFSLISLKIEGNCCWEVFKESNFSGNSEQFSPNGGLKNDGKYQSAVQMKSVFRHASSVRKGCL